jgi:hypothetical protein
VRSVSRTTSDSPGAGESRFPDPSGAEENERADGVLGVLEARRDALAYFFPALISKTSSPFLKSTVTRL